MHRPLRLTIDRSALQANWSWLQERAGVLAGAAIKADGYGLGAREAAQALYHAGCRDFFVSTWSEAEALGPLPVGTSLVVLHGVGPNDLEAALASTARPVVNTAEQVARWKEAAPGRACDVMIDTGMNRLGLRPEEIAVLDGLEIDTLHSHLACADEDNALNAKQLERFRDIKAQVPAHRYSLANSAGICLGREYSFDLVRPGLALYGGVPRPEAAGHIAQVVRPRAQILQRRTVRPGQTGGYSATFVATSVREIAVLNLGYADGYLRGFSGTGAALLDGQRLPLLGRVSMDLIAIDVTSASHLREGDWLELEYDLPIAAAQSGLTQYELLTAMGRRYERVWI